MPLTLNSSAENEINVLNKCYKCKCISRLNAKTVHFIFWLKNVYILLKISICWTNKFTEFTLFKCVTLTQYSTSNMIQALHKIKHQLHTWAENQTHNAGVLLVWISPTSWLTFLLNSLSFEGISEGGINCANIRDRNKARCRKRETETNMFQGLVSTQKSDVINKAFWI